MNAIKFLISASIALLIFGGCQQDEFVGTEHQKKNLNLQNQQKLGRENGSVVRPFKAHFSTIRNYSETGEGYCEATPATPAFNYQYDENCGTATHMGLIKKAEMYFCGGAPGPLGIPYTNGQGTLTGANGDEIHIEIPPAGETGYVVFLAPGSDPIYEAYFETPFRIVGGTGRFLGASGEGMTNSYVDLFDENGDLIPEHQTDHEWIGTIKY